MLTKSRQFYEDVLTEMKKVNWPERDELINATFVVFVISALFTLFIFGADTVMSFVVDLIY